eukprot:49286_1
MGNHFQSSNNEIRKYADLPQSTIFFQTETWYLSGGIAGGMNGVKIIFECILNFITGICDASVGYAFITNDNLNGGIDATGHFAWDVNDKHFCQIKTLSMIEWNSQLIYIPTGDMMLLFHTNKLFGYSMMKKNQKLWNGICC